MAVRSTEPVELVKGMTVRIGDTLLRVDRLVDVLVDERPLAILVGDRQNDRIGSAANPTPLHHADDERYSHVDDDVQPLLWGTVQDRRARLRSDVAERTPWIPRHAQLDAVRRLHELTDSAAAGAPSRLVIAGARGAGKRSMATRFRDERNGSAGGEQNVPIVLARSWLSTQNFYDYCLDGIDPRRRVYAKDVLRRPGMRNDDRRSMVAAAVSAAGVRTLLVENLYGYSGPTSGAVRRRVETLDAFADELGLCMVCLQDKPLSLPGTWPTPWRDAPTVSLPRCGLDDEFHEALATFGRRLPLKQSSALTRRDLAARLYARSHGNLKALWLDLVDLADEALEGGIERIDHELIDRVEAHEQEVERAREDQESALEW